MKMMSIVATGLLAAGLVGVDAMPSEGNPFVTRCVGEGGAVTIPGDLVVPAGEVCLLNGTNVQGNARVQAGADLVILGGSIGGNVNVRENAYFEADGTNLGGNVAARESFGSLVVESTVQGVVSTVSEESDLGWLIVDSSTLHDRVRATGGALDLASTSVANQVVGLGAEYVDVYDSTVGGNLRVEDSLSGSLVCDSEVYGNTRMINNAVGVQLGGTRADGGFVNCAGANYMDGNVVVNNTEGGVWAFDNIVAGNLNGQGNDPAPLGDRNRVRGNVGGQFADMSAFSLSQQAQDESVANRGEELREMAQERRSGVVKEAEAIGPAF